MESLRPVGYVIGLLLTALAAVMALPMLLDLWLGDGNAPGFFKSALLTGIAGISLALSCASAQPVRMSLRQTFALTTLVWIVLPAFGALPFVLGAPGARYVDAYFEAMSGMTTTGSTVFSGLDFLPSGILLWRGLLQWIGGVGIIVVAIVFLPELRVGGMQMFRSEAFDTGGKILPRATQIAARISVVYLGLSVVCALSYAALGMTAFDAIVHAMTTISTGGMANYDASFAAFDPATEYVACIFMILAALPFVRFVQILAGSWGALWRDPQVRGFFWVYAVCVGLVLVALLINGRDLETSLHKALFNIASILTGTGYASEDYMLWGGFGVTIMFLAGLIGGCSGSTACSVKIFRYQLLLAAIVAQVRQIHTPSGVFAPRYDGRAVQTDVLHSVMSFFVIFVVLLGLFAVLLSMTGLDVITSVSGAATALANIGPGLGDQIGPAGNFAGLSDAAKWILSAAMLIGRLELMVVLVFLTRRFWVA